MQTPNFFVNQSLGSTFIIQSTAASRSLWNAERNDVVVVGVGAAGLLHGPLTAFFASRQCPGTAIRAATDWALQQARLHCAVVGGFHSPLEQSVLRLLLETGNPVVVVLARPVVNASLRSEWRTALDAGKLAVVCRTQTVDRLTQQSADERNDLAARLADQVVVAHASMGGSLARQCALWSGDGLKVRYLADAAAPR